MHNLNEDLHNSKYKFEVEERRKKAASLLAQSMTKTEIAQELNVDRSTVSREILQHSKNCNKFISVCVNICNTCNNNKHNYYVV